MAAPSTGFFSVGAADTGEQTLPRCEAVLSMQGAEQHPGAPPTAYQQVPPLAVTACPVPRRQSLPNAVCGRGDGSTLPDGGQRDRKSVRQACEDVAAWSGMGPSDWAVVPSQEKVPVWPTVVILQEVGDRDFSLK